MTIQDVIAIVRENTSGAVEYFRDELKRRGLTYSEVFGWCSKREIDFINRKLLEGGYPSFSRLQGTPCYINENGKTIIEPWVHTVSQMKWARHKENEQLTLAAEMLG